MGTTGKIKCRGILISVSNTSSQKKNRIGLFFILFGVNNDTRQIMKSMNHNHNFHNLERKVIVMTITFTLVSTLTFIKTKELTTSHIQLKGRQGEAFMGRLWWIPRRMLYIVQHVMLNWVCCAIVYVILVLKILRWKTVYFFEIKKFKSQENHQIFYFCMI